MAYDLSGTAYIEVPVVTDPADLVDETDGVALSTLPGASYGACKRFKIRITADAAGEFNLAWKGLDDDVWAWVGFSAGDVNSGQSFSCSGADVWILEGGSLALFTRLAAVLTIASGTPTVTAEIIGIGDA